MLAGLAASAVCLPGTNAHPVETRAMGHVVLLGDSVFDNSAYVGGGPDVVTQLRERLPNGWRATLRAVDGSVVAGLAEQIARIPSDATHLVISAGGNDALGYSAILGAPSGSMAESLTQLADIREEFRARYAAAMTRVSQTGLPAAVSTIYDPRYADPVQRRLGTTALTVVNDVIIREAVRDGLPVLDLRIICDDDADFANPIEPSSHGGWKIAGAIASLLAKHDFGRGISEVFTR
jgi:lysophospholipase L1-like esterase